MIFSNDDNPEIQYKGAIYLPFEEAEEIVDVMTETDVSDFDEDLLETDNEETDEDEDEDDRMRMKMKKEDEE